jgi:pimeloyl-ACP methyl ester carboxylesterase
MVDQPRKGPTWWSRTGTAIAGDGTPLAFASGGPEGARAILCCNGLGVSTFFWDYVGAHFSKDHHVVIWDYRGHGASGRPRDPSTITMGTIADDVARVMDANRVDRAIVLGHSLGCQVLFEFYRLFADRVLGLVPMLGAFGKPADTFLSPRVGPKFYEAAYAVGSRIPDVINTFAQVTLRSRLAWPFARVTGLVHPDLAKKSDMEPYLDHLARLDFRVFFEMARAAQDHDASDLLGDIEAPVLVVAGERDLFTPHHLSLAMSQRIPNAELLEIPRGSHAALIEQPELINLRMEKFIRDRIAPYERQPISAERGSDGHAPPITRFVA